MNLINLSGRTFHGWTVLSKATSKNKETMWLCRCACGKERPVNAHNLLKGLSKSCGCRSGKQQHNKYKTPEWKIWNSMIERCSNPNNNSWHLYGERGIVVHPKWLLFENFLADMGTRPSVKHSIDRFPNNDGPYSAENCRWATSKQQSRNMRVNRFLTNNEKTLCIAEWAEYTGLSSSLIRARIDELGWSVHDALTTPAGQKRICNR